MIIDEDEYLAHYGILRRSGRYPWGSGGPEYASNRGFLDMIADMKRQGLSDTEVARGIGISTTALRAAKSIAKNEEKQAKLIQVQKLKDLGNSNVAIGRALDIPESSVRAMLAPGFKEKNDILTNVANTLKKNVDEKTYVDVGAGIEYQLNVSSTMLKNAVAVLREQGYEMHDLKIPQVSGSNFTNMKVLSPPGTTRHDVWINQSKVKQITEYSDDGGRTLLNILPPKSIHPDRVEVRYSEKNKKGDEIGGGLADGIIYVRPGVKDISLGGSQYAQVRVLVGKDRYLKGMAMYKNDLPDGVDLLFNTSKPKGEDGKLGAMKKTSDDPDNPFGAVIKRQILDDTPGPNKKVSSVMNIVNEEGDWGEWSKNLSSQMLSKQSPSLARSQLNMTYERRMQEFDRISSLTNPTVRKKLLDTFADETDSAAVHLKAAALSTSQASQVILPLKSIKPTEIFAPRFQDGERVVLIRHPHAGTFEIPELVVNNKHREGRSLIGKDAKDAVGIHPSVAERLSGADFDGDTVVVIPNNNNKVKTTPALDQLKGFDPRVLYKGYEGMPKMSSDRKQREMGDISNLITDMTIKGASHAELARAVKHSMVVIDAEKHDLNYKQSALDNGIKSLKQKYQGKGNAGASTLVSLARQDTRINKRRERPASKGGSVDKDTGKKVYEETGEGYRNVKGEFVLRKDKVERLAVTDDAHTLSSGTRMETVYADHSNKLKDLANRARKESVRTPNAEYSPSAAKVYAPRVKRLDAALAIAQANAPLERQAQIIANATVKQKKDQIVDLDKAQEKKLKSQALAAARARTAAKKARIEISGEEWEAIQAGAISHSKLDKILDNADLEIVKQLATPKQQRLMTPNKIANAQAKLAAGFTRAQVAQQLGVSLTTLDEALK